VLRVHVPDGENEPPEEDGVDCMKTDKTSMLYWYPKIKLLRIPQPRTEMIKTKLDITSLLGDCDGLTEEGVRKHIYIPAIERICECIGYPVFMRSDFTSHKHNWEKSCYVARKEDIIPHLQDIIEFSGSADIFGGISFTAVVIRRYIEMATLFTAFYGNMPVNPEFRFFIHEGKVICHHWYWVEDAIQNPSVKNWKGRIHKCWKKIDRDDDLSRLDGYARMVAEVLHGSWSIDFCLGADGIWYLIDMAESHKSWHPEECPNHKKIRMS
jgi:hypothetical protein